MANPHHSIMAPFRPNNKISGAVIHSLPNNLAIIQLFRRLKFPLRQVIRDNNRTNICFWHHANECGQMNQQIINAILYNLTQFEKILFCIFIIFIFCIFYSFNKHFCIFFFVNFN